MSVDPANPKKIYAGSEHSGFSIPRTAARAGSAPNRNTPKMMLFSALALDGGVHGRNHPVGGVSQQERQVGRIGRRAHPQRWREFPA